jgi:hypothetical protein
MKIEEMIRDASAELRAATEKRPVPPPRFGASPTRRKRHRWQLALAAVVSLSVAALVVRAIDHDNDPQKIDTVVPPTTTPPSTSQSGPRLSIPPPETLPYYVGFPSSSLSRFASWGVTTELLVEPGVENPSRGRIIDQQPGGGTPLVQGMKVTFRVGQPTAMLDGEFEVGSGANGPKGAWRVVASTKTSFQDPFRSPYGSTLLFLTDEFLMISSDRLEAQAFRAHDYADQVGLIAGTAPAGAVEVLLMDANGNTLGSVTTMRFDDPYFALVSFWLIETAKHPSYASLRAIDRDGNVVAEYPGR